MKTYTTEIDTVKLQLDFDTPEQQHSVQKELIDYISKYYHVNFKDFTNELTRQVNRVFFTYYKNTFICSFSTGIYTAYDKYKRPSNIYYISIKLAGIKRYNQDIDQASNDCLFRLCGLLNINDIAFKITQLDLAIDINAKFNNILTVCTKRTPNTKYFSLSEQQKFEQTRYVEDIAYNRRYKVSKHAYTYDKAYKEELSFDLTRFELSLSPKFFSKNGVSIDSIAQALDRYHVMYFPTITEKKKKINEYENYNNFRSRDIERIGFEAFRLYPNLAYIKNFLHWMSNVTLLDFNDNYDLRNNS